MTRGESMEWTAKTEIARHERRPARVLILDDDVDSALRVHSVFSHLGCETTCTPAVEEGRRKMCALKSDIIILDWMLGQDVDAEDVVDDWAQTFRRLGWTGAPPWGRPKIITYSSLDESQIHRLNTPYFDHLAHWKKSVTQRELLMRSLQLLNRIGR